MKTIEKHKPFDNFYESKGKLYAVLEQKTKTIEDTEDLIYVAKVLEITQEQKLKGYEKILKEHKLNNLTVEVAEFIFYADSESRIDISATLDEAKELNLTDDYEIEWKTKEGWKTVTVANLKEARKKALQVKANLIGAEGVQTA